MRFINPCRSLLRKLTLFTFCLALLSIMFLHSPVLAGNVNSNGSAFIDWSTLNITLNGSSFDPAAALNPDLNAPGSTSAFSGAQVQLSSDQTDVGGGDASDGSLPTFANAFSSNPNLSSVNATGQTTTNAIPGMTTGLSASLTMNVNSPDTAGLPNGVPNQANAAYYFTDFIAPLSGPLQVSVNYLLSNYLSSDDPNLSIASSVLAGLFLYGYDADGFQMNDPIAMALAGLSNSIIGMGLIDLTNNGLGIGGSLALTYNLTAGSHYDLNGEVLAHGSAPVPEPATMLLLASGLAGLGGLRRFRKRASN